MNKYNKITSRACLSYFLLLLAAPSSPCLCVPCPCAPLLSFNPLFSSTTFLLCSNPNHLLRYTSLHLIILKSAAICYAPPRKKTRLEKGRVAPITKLASLLRTRAKCSYSTFDFSSKTQRRPATTQKPPPQKCDQTASGGSVCLVSHRSLSMAAFAVHSSFSVSFNSLHFAAMPFITSVTLQASKHHRGETWAKSKKSNILQRKRR